MPERSEKPNGPEDDPQKPGTSRQDRRETVRDLCERIDLHALILGSGRTRGI